MIEAYPLSWPIDYPRTKHYSKSRYRDNTTFGRSRDRLIRELKLLKADKIIISSNIPLKRDGLPYATFRIEDPGIAVYFNYKNSPTVYVVINGVSQVIISMLSNVL